MFTIGGLLESAMRAGVPVPEFWAMTPAETFAVLVAAAWREERAHERMVRQAWLIAGLQRQKRLPRLARLLQRKAVELTPEQMAETREEHARMVERYRASHAPSPDPSLVARERGADAAGGTCNAPKKVRCTDKVD